MKSISFQVLLVLTLFFTSCITGKKTAKYFQDKEAQQNTITLKDIKITPTRKDNFRTTPIRSMDILHMDLDVRFNWGKHECIGKETILLKPYFYAQDSIVLDAKNMIFDGITVTDMRDNPIQYLVNYDKKILKIQLEKKIPSQDSIKLSISYVASPDLKEKGGSRAIKDDKGLYFINTDNQEPYKPIQLWTQGETESNSCWFPTIDKPNEKFTSKLSITVNKELTTLSNGALINSITNETQRTDTWENTQPMSAYLIMMAVGNFISTKDQWRGKEVSYYLEPDYSPYARSIFNNTSDMLEYYSNRLGVEYPWNKYAQVVVRDYVSGAMENTSATLHGEFVQKNNRELIDNDNDGIIAHELFHQWFGDLVTCKSWSHLVLNEGFATYGEQLWIEHKEGKDASLRKCYNTINRYISYAKNASDDAIVNFNYKDKEDMFNTLTYQKGSRVIHLLRSILGDDAFFLGLKNYLTHYAFNNAELDDLRKEFENVSGQDLRPFFQQWFLQGGHPIIDLRYDYIDSLGLLAVTVEQKQTSDVGLFQFPLAFKVTQGRLSKIYNFQIDKKKEVFYVKKIDIDNPDRVDVNVDPEAIFIGEIIDHKPFFNHILTYNRATNYIEKVRSLKELSLLQNQNDSVRFTLLSAINDADDDIRLKALEWINWKNPDNLLKTKDILINIARNDNHAEVRSKAVEILSDTKSPELMNVYFDLVNDSSYTVAGEALQAIFRIIPEEAYRQCPRLEKDARGKLFSTISDIYASSGTLNDTAFFNSNLMRVYGSRRSALLTDYTSLILRQQNDELNQLHIQRLTLHAQSSMYSTVRVTAIKQLKSIKDYYTQLESKTTDPALKSQYKLSIDQLTQSIDSIIAQEKDAEVISQLKFSGIIPANYEIKSEE
jgi:aminopeptidase N